jgi:type IV secretory pathway VirB2 component (pilin)
MRPIIGRLTATNWVAHFALILAAATAAAILASRPEGDPLRRVVSFVLGVLAFLLIIQNLVERYPPGGRVSHGIPYAISAAASIIMVVGQSMPAGSVATGSAEVSALLFAIGLIMLAFQVRGLPRSA